MAKIEATVWVEDVVRGQSGAVFVLKTAETHSKKDENGKYQTTARTFRDVKVSKDSGINLDAFAKGDRINIAGREISEKVASTTGGKDFFPLVIWADSITTAERSGNAPVPSAAEPVDSWNAEPTWAVAEVPADDPSLPF